MGAGEKTRGKQHAVKVCVPYCISVSNATNIVLNTDTQFRLGTAYSKSLGKDGNKADSGNS